MRKRIVNLETLCVLPVLLVATAQLQAQESQGTFMLVPNHDSVDASLNGGFELRSDEPVTMGIPFAPCTLFDSAAFRLLDENGSEVRLFAKETLMWPETRQPCGATSIRALKVQFEFDATRAGIVEYTWTLAGRNTQLDRAESPVAASEVVDVRENKAGYREPRVLAIHPPSYLLQTGLIPPTARKDDSAYDEHYYPQMWQRYVLDYDLTLTRKTADYLKPENTQNKQLSAAEAAIKAEEDITDDWLYDLVSATYRQAMRRGEPAIYREAYLMHEWYIGKIEVTGNKQPGVAGQENYCIGGFDVGVKVHTFGSGGAGCDTKYIYVEPYKLHLALTGDDSWQPQENGAPNSTGVVDDRHKVWRAIADLLWNGSTRLGSNAGQPAIPPPGFRTPYASIGDSFSERRTGFGLQALLAVCELSLDMEVCGRVDTIVDNLHDMYRANPDGRGAKGYLAHSWRIHEGSGLPWLGSLAQDYVEPSATVDIRNTLANGPASLVTGDSIRIGRNTDRTLTAPPQRLEGGIWRLTLDAPVTTAANDAGRRVFTLREAGGSDEAIIFDQATDRIFSPWMQSIIADGLWSYYHWTDDNVRKQKAADLLLGFARAYAAYAIDGTRLQEQLKTTLEQAFDVRIFDNAITAKVCSQLSRAPYTRYVANDLMAGPEANKPYLDYMFASGGFADQHIPEGIFQLALGVYFETDGEKRAAMLELLAAMEEWFEKYDCTITDRQPPRTYGWQNKPDPYGTYAYVRNLAADYAGLADAQVEEEQE